LDIDLGVDNELGSTLFFNRFDYGLSLGGNDVADGVVPTFDVGGATKSTLTLPVTVDLFSLGAGVVDAILDGGSVDVGLEATMDVDTPFGVVPLTIDETGQVSISD
jgi:hypothetical protein